MIWILAFILITYAILILFSAKIWITLPSNLLECPYQNFSATKPLLSVIIVFRNEQSNLPLLIESLRKQELPQKFWEILWVDDFSEDNSRAIVENAKLLNSKILTNNALMHIPSPKKRAITYAISHAQGKWIVCTDADCQVPPHWLSSILSFFQKTNAYFVSMPVKIQVEKDFFSQWQAVEFASLIGIGAVCITLRKPTMCNGANIAYSKEIFKLVGGFTGSEHIASGDDELLMHKIAKQFPHKVAFLKSPKVLVSTQPQASWIAFFHQRKRWASKWEHYENIFAKMLAVWVFLVNFAMILSLIYLFSKTWIVLGVLAFKLIAEFIFLTCILSFFNQAKLAKWIPVLFVIYPIYAVFFALVSRSRKYQWKQRNYERT